MKPTYNTTELIPGDLIILDDVYPDIKLFTGTTLRELHGSKLVVGRGAIATFLEYKNFISSKDAEFCKILYKGKILFARIRHCKKFKPAHLKLSYIK